MPSATVEQHHQHARKTDLEVITDALPHVRAGCNNRRLDRVYGICANDVQRQYSSVSDYASVGSAHDAELEVEDEQPRPEEMQRDADHLRAERNNSLTKRVEESTLRVVHYLEKQAGQIAFHIQPSEVADAFVLTRGEENILSEAEQDGDRHKHAAEDEPSSIQILAAELEVSGASRLTDQSVESAV